ncbi:EAL domain-containing protein [Pseudosporangium ferrugineum]|uniref:PAS domain S-box-containing protein n=1 Tax=Pseudosporangium ferrugineum TaxID=439699 RepID=A0A2T0RX20_9ACTN|nr:EAL domain-containing protein [Pseudosporangium ferrugineum]PRY25672.1 PAS domain S-box-containing protein [Pseudosporangium ferrugineum]
MNLDDVIALASARTPSHLDRARTRRAARQVLDAYARTAADGRDPLGDLDAGDVLGPQADEAGRITRAAQSARAGWLRWDRATGRLTWSDAMSQTFGYPAVTPVITVDVLAAGVHPEDFAEAEAAVRRGWRDRVPVELTVRVVRPDGALRYAHCLVELLSDDGLTPTGIVATVHDITRRELDRQEHDRRRRRERMAPHRPPAADAPPALMTRAGFADAVDLAAHAGTGAVLVMSLEPVGGAEPEAGALERAVTPVLGGAGDARGSLGMFEFAVLFRDPAAAAPAAAELQRRLGTVTVGGARLRASAGLVPLAGPDRPSGHDVLLDGEWAAAEAHRRRVPLHSLPGPRPAARRERAVRDRIDAAVRGGQLCLYAQPILDLALHEVTRHEILLRVRRPGRTAPELPAAFLAAAERGDGIVTVDRWVIDRSLALIGQGPQTSQFQINISGRTLSHPGTAAYVLDALRRHDVDPRRITFEITESLVITNGTAAAEFAAAVTAVGCELALDDFGTGYSSLGVLRALPIGLLKIDGGFVAGLSGSPADRAIVSSLAGMSRALGVRTAAEAAEDPATVELLRDLGVDFAQGYAIGRPHPFAASPAADLTAGPELGRATG